MNPLFGIGAAALQNPEVQNAALGGIRSVLGSLGRVGGYVGEGLTGNILQPAFNKLGDIGNQYLPTRLANLGTQARRGIYGLGQAAIGAEPGQGIWDAIYGRNLPGPQQQAQQAVANAQVGPGAQAIPGVMGPEQAAQAQYLQQIQQPYQFDYANQRQQLINQYNQQLVPQLARRFAGANALGTGAFQRGLSQVSGNLLTNLGALEEQGRMREAEMNQARLGQIANYLGGQQQLGLNARRLGLEGTIAQRADALRGLGLMGGFAQGQQQNYLGQLGNALNAQVNAANIGMGQPGQVVQTHGGPSGFAQMLPWILSGGVQAGRRMAGL